MVAGLYSFLSSSSVALNSLVCRFYGAFQAATTGLGMIISIYLRAKSWVQNVELNIKAPKVRKIFILCDMDPHTVQHKYSASHGRPAPGPQASCPGHASLRHLRSFPCPPTQGRRRERLRPASEWWLDSTLLARSFSIADWLGSTSINPSLWFYFLLLELSAPVEVKEEKGCCNSLEEKHSARRQSHFLVR